VDVYLEWLRPVSSRVHTVVDVGVA
jgi:hypothetical protein